jgi:hypothetical protein
VHNPSKLDGAPASLISVEEPDCACGATCPGVLAVFPGVLAAFPAAGATGSRGVVDDDSGSELPAPPEAT